MEEFPVLHAAYQHDASVAEALPHLPTEDISKEDGTVVEMQTTVDTGAIPSTTVGKQPGEAIEDAVCAAEHLTWDNSQDGNEAPIQESGDWGPDVSTPHKPPIKPSFPTKKRAVLKKSPKKADKDDWKSNIIQTVNKLDAKLCDSGEYLERKIINHLTNFITSLIVPLEENNASIKDRLKLFESTATKITELCDDYDTLRSALASTNQLLKSKEKEVSSLRSDLASLKDQMTTLEDRIGSHGATTPTPQTTNGDILAIAKDVKEIKENQKLNFKELTDSISRLPGSGQLSPALQLVPIQLPIQPALQQHTGYLSPAQQPEVKSDCRPPRSQPSQQHTVNRGEKNRRGE